VQQRALVFPTGKRSYDDIPVIHHNGSRLMFGDQDETATLVNSCPDTYA
jgi:hypothetical protein